MSTGWEESSISKSDLAAVNALRRQFRLDGRQNFARVHVYGDPVIRQAIADLN